MTPFSSVAMLEKLALLKMAFCSAPVLSRAASRPTSVTTSGVISLSSVQVAPLFSIDIIQPFLAPRKRGTLLADALSQARLWPIDRFARSATGGQVWAGSDRKVYSQNRTHLFPLFS